ncbi:hypothetical protein FZZ92_01755 [Synechococcus sp. MU1611]|nr:hypothetical protein [Synechococcus sp. MU1650]MCB4410575.1 hypothetical protein [Synechococcus sp. MU1611]
MLSSKRAQNVRKTSEQEGFCARLVGTRLALLDEIIEASIRCKQHSNAVGALKLQAQLTRLLKGS